jgi:hypothetical protein
VKRLGVSAYRPLLLTVLGLTAALAAMPGADALHSLRDRYGAEQWWVDLKPWGDHRISYLLCGLPYELPPEWEWGVENWDAMLSSYMDFDLHPLGCSDSADTWLAWELQNECADPSFGCWERWNWQGHGTWDELQLTIIFFNYDGYHSLGEGNPAWEDAFQMALSAHEWGHNLNLEDHWMQDMCWQPNLIMGYINPWQPPCRTGPTSAELDAVLNNYGLLDSDGDDFVDAVEGYVGTDPRDNCPDNSSDAAWPLDINNDRAITVPGDVLAYSGRIGAVPGDPNWWQRLDLNADGAITVPGDVMMYSGKIGATCT